MSWYEFDERFFVGAGAARPSEKPSFEGKKSWSFL
jgi:hypothetical protein